MEQILIDSNYIEQCLNKDFLQKLIKNDMVNIEFKYLSVFSNSKIIRDSFSILADIFDIPTVWKTRTILILDELVNNSIEYWSQKNETNYLRLFIEKNTQSIILKIEAEDAWNWPQNKKANEMELLREKKLKDWFGEHFSIRWRWLFMIITRLVDKLYFEDSSAWWLIVWINKRIEN